MTWHLPMTALVTPESAGWGFSGLRILTLAPGQAHTSAPDDAADEAVVIPLSGSCMVDCDSDSAELAGRPGVFSGVTDVAYLPRGAGYRITSPGGGRFALATARASRAHPFRHITADQVRVEHRGTGPCARVVNNFGTPDVLDAERIIACEVVTPAGNWSSYPPHKHDIERDGESQLEEIYYFEIGRSGMGYLKAAEVLAEVRTGDVVLVPYGFHGPAMAVPGYDMYYLNVMAGPGKREWLICDDPAHAWIRETWR